MAHYGWTINTIRQDRSFSQVIEEDLTRSLSPETCRVPNQIVEMPMSHRPWVLAANLIHVYLVEEAWAASQISSTNATALDHLSTLHKVDFLRMMCR